MGRARRPLDKAWVSACVEQACSDSTIVINELGLDVSQFGFERPGTYFGAPAPGILGWSLGAALGAKLAAMANTSRKDPAEVPAALERAVRVVQQEQQQALLNMVST